MIVGTAGHIDHGKTTLVKALTGVDTDRLPEEKRRGITIELGYAFLDVPGQPGQPAPTVQRIGFIDVPGHERLVHTMLAGATGIDFALLLVAADDGVMPQTREHLAVLSLLGLQHGAVAITKTDRADPRRVQAVRDEVAALLQGSALQGAPVLAVSAVGGQGLAELKALLFDAAQRLSRPADHGAAGCTAWRPAFRLAIDRSFTLGGVGTVATGTVHAGQAGLGDALAVVPSAPGSPGPARVRSLHAQNRTVASAHAGQRCAVALAGIDTTQAPRGHWLCADAAALATTRIDTTLTLWHAEPRPLRTGTRVHVHLGAASVLGSVAVLDGDSLAPGGSARVQLVLHSAVGAWWGDRVVLRDATASRTLAGGRVLDPHAPARYRRTPQRLAELDALAAPTPAARLHALLAVAPQGVDLRQFAAAQGLLGAAFARDLPAGALHQQDGHGSSALGASQAALAQAAVLHALAQFHHQHPEELGPDAARLRRLALPRLPLPLWRALLAQAQQAGALTVKGAFLHLPAHGVHLSAVDQRIAQKIAPLLAQAGFEGAWARDLARDAREPEPLLRTTLARLAQQGDLHQVVKDLYVPAPVMAQLADMARAVAAASGGDVTAGRFRDATGLGRKRAIQVLEYLDRVGLLRRVGDLHKLRQDSALFTQAASA